MVGSDDIGVWDAEAERYDEASDHGLLDPSVRAAWRELLLAALPPAPARVADLGCGTATLAVLLADEGYAVDGLDSSPAMLARARTKAGDRPGVTLTAGDAAEPRLPPASYDVVLCRHVLWTLPEPAAVLRRWIALLAPGGRLVLVEGRWLNEAGLNEAGLSAARTIELVEAAGRTATLTRLDDPAYWGRAIDDERYLVVSAR